MRIVCSFIVVAVGGAPAAAQSLAPAPVSEHVLPPVDPSDWPAAHAAPVAEPLADLATTFQLHSRPSASKTIYLDFDGHVTTNTLWNTQATGGDPIVTPVYDPDHNGATFTSNELARIRYIWERVVEDFSPFDVNVTTEAPSAGDLIKSGGGDDRWGVRVAIGDNNWRSAAGGVAYVGSFNWSNDTPTFVFTNSLGNGHDKLTAEAISHEVGHTLGLSHDGRTSPKEDYYGGHGSGAVSWAPIMGVGYYQNLSQWSEGEYANANQTQDDLEIITTRNGFGYRPDDHGDTLALATTLTVTDDTAISAEGVISTRDDQDLFRFIHGGGVASLLIEPFERGPNLDILAELLDAAGNVLMTSNPLGSLYAQFAVNLLPGEYYLRVDGVGMGNPGGGGYSDYGSLGQYFLSGTIGAGELVPEPTTLAMLTFAAGTILRRRRSR